MYFAAVASTSSRLSSSLCCRTSFAAYRTTRVSQRRCQSGWWPKKDDEDESILNKVVRKSTDAVKGVVSAPVEYAKKGIDTVTNLPNEALKMVEEQKKNLGHYLVGDSEKKLKTIEEAKVEKKEIVRAKPPPPPPVESEPTPSMQEQLTEWRQKWSEKTQSGWRKGKRFVVVAVLGRYLLLLCSGAGAILVGAYTLISLSRPSQSPTIQVFTRPMEEAASGEQSELRKDLAAMNKKIDSLARDIDNMKSAMNVGHYPVDSDSSSSGVNRLKWW
ncbi:hypothetical protein AAVH_20602 [Aphelenchoides avenae]|nr:hypothetical protein AAVH_20602 [Aphelenchus avenae]